MSIQLVPVGDTGVLAVFEQKIDEEIGAQGGAGCGRARRKDPRRG